ncbi:MAG: hypothetical protein JXB38_08995 [Anaerolineales bacterium]|nr:hypothetical protein [Anaerolineales bacterium]
MSEYQIAALNEDQFNKVQTIEEELDLHVLALEPGLEFAQLSPDQLEKVKKLEQELGLTLVVYKI